MDGAYRNIVAMRDNYIYSECDDIFGNNLSSKGNFSGVYRAYIRTSYPLRHHNVYTALKAEVFLLFPAE